MNKNKKVILFDGVCNFCNFWVNFIIDHDVNKIFVFASIQSETGKELFKRYNISEGFDDSFILIDDDKYLIKSNASFHVAEYLSFPFNLISWLKILPGFFSDFVYDLIAKNRYLIFGKRESCRIPTEELRSRFID